MSAQRQTWSLYRGEDGQIVLTGADDTNPAAFALSFQLSAYPGGTPVLTVASPAITTDGAGPYRIIIPLTRAQTSALSRARYSADLWRTDAGSNTRLAGGWLTVDAPVRPPA